MLALLQGQSQQIERGANPIADFDYNAKQEELKRMFSKQDEALSAARAKLGREIGETQLQSIEQALPGIYRGSKYLARRTGISDKIDQAKKSFDDFTTRTKGRVSQYIDNLSPEGISKFMKNRAGVPRAEPNQDPRYQPPGSEIEMSEIGEIAEPTQNPNQDPRYQPPPKAEVGGRAEPNSPEIEGHIDTAVLNSMGDRIQRLPEAGIDWFNKETIKYNRSKGIENDGSPFLEPGRDALPDPDLLQGHAEILKEAGRQFGYREGLGLQGGGRVSDFIDRFNRGGGGKARQQPIQETPAPEEDIDRLYREQAAPREVKKGERGEQYISRAAKGGTSREALETTRQVPDELENPIEPPQQEYRGERDPDRRPGGRIERGYQTLKAPTEEQHLASIKRQTPPAKKPEADDSDWEDRPYDEPNFPPPPEVKAYVEGTTTTTQLATNRRRQGAYGQDDIDGTQARGSIGMGGRAPAAVAAEAAQRARTRTTRPAPTAEPADINDPLARSAPSYGSVGNPLRGTDAPPPPPPRTSAPKPQARPVAAEPIATQTPPTVAPKSKKQGTPIETQTEPIQGKEQETQTETPQEGSAEGSTSRFGGYGLEAGFGLAAVGELANPLSTAQDKMKEVAATGALYGATKVGESALKSAGLEAGLPEIMTGVEVGQDLLDKDKTDTQKAVAVGTAVGEYGGAMAAEALVPGLGEIAMVGTALGGLFEGLHKEHEEEDEQKQQAATLAAKQRAQQTQLNNQRPGVAFDSAPVIDSSSYHNL